MVEKSCKYFEDCGNSQSLICTSYNGRYYDGSFCGNYIRKEKEVRLDGL